MKIAIAIVTGIAVLLWGIVWACSRSSNIDNREAADLYAVPALTVTLVDVALVIGFALWRLFST